MRGRLWSLRRRSLCRGDAPHDQSAPAPSSTSIVFYLFPSRSIPLRPSASPSSSSSQVRLPKLLLFDLTYVAPTLLTVLTIWTLYSTISVSA